ncbi:MAG: hypothetical protein U0800_28025 [Isosphaeraceae bacterium]
MRPQNLNRQIFYAATIAVLFGVMYPYRSYVNQVHNDYDLGEPTIGIDNGSFVLNLFALGGFRGIVANVLWGDAINLQRAHEWDRLEAKVDMITKLQPHFLSIWTFQGWNLAYNVSVEWDDPADKYRYIKRGINFLKQGSARNPKSPDLMWDTAWTYFHKIGQADEAVILRKLFRDDEDEEFKTDPTTNEIKNDNFLLGLGWFRNALRLVDEGGTRLGGGVETRKATAVDPHENRKRPDDLNFRSMPAHAQTRYALSLEKASIKGVEAVFGERAKNEWERAYGEWRLFGNYSFPVPNLLPGQTEADRQKVRIGLIDQPEEFNKLSDNERHWIDRWASQTNFPYWTDRCRAEMEPEGYEARRLFYEGTKALRAGQFITETDKDGTVRLGAVQCYRDGLELWQSVLERHKNFGNDQLNAKDAGLIVKRYVQVLQNAGEEIPRSSLHGTPRRGPSATPRSTRSTCWKSSAPVLDKPARGPPGTRQPAVLVRAS